MFSNSGTVRPQHFHKTLAGSTCGRSHSRASAKQLTENRVPGRAYVAKLDDNAMAPDTTIATRLALLALLTAAATSAAHAQDSNVQQQLSNPVASLTLVPFQYNYDARIGPAEDGHRSTLNFQPVVPFKLDGGWSLVVRTIIPMISQNSIFPGSGDQSGLGDTLQSFFLVPRTVNGFTFGAGPAIQYRSGTETLLTSGKWAADPDVGSSRSLWLPQPWRRHPSGNRHRARGRGCPATALAPGHCVNRATADAGLRQHELDALGRFSVAGDVGND
jgi:hypothetical protein